MEKEHSFYESAEVRAKLSHLRLDAALALAAYSIVRDELSAVGFVTAQAKYTLACAEVKNESILDYVEVDHGI